MNPPTRIVKQMTQDFTRTVLDNYHRKHLTAKNADYISKHNEKLIKDFYTTIKGNMDKKTEQYLIGGRCFSSDTSTPTRKA